METSIVGRGVDTLLLNVYYTDADGKPDKRDLAPFLVEQLNAWKNRAIAAEEPVVVPLALAHVPAWGWSRAMDVVTDLGSHQCVCLAGAAQLYRAGTALLGIPLVMSESERSD